MSTLPESQYENAGEGKHGIGIACPLFLSDVKGPNKPVLNLTQKEHNDGAAFTNRTDTRGEFAEKSPAAAEKETGYKGSQGFGKNHRRVHSTPSEAMKKSALSLS